MKRTKRKTAVGRMIKLGWAGTAALAGIGLSSGSALAQDATRVDKVEKENMEAQPRRAGSRSGDRGVHNASYTRRAPGEP